MSRALLLAAVACSALTSPGAVSAAEEYPSRPIKIIVSYAPGGATDLAARMLAHQMSERLRQPVVVENKPGAATIIGNDTVAKSSPDGYTLLYGASPVAMNIALGVKQPYDTFRDFAPISLVATVPILFVVHPTSPHRTLRDVVEAARVRPEGLSYATAGAGSMNHLVGEALRATTRVNLVHIGYKGSAPALQDVLAGTVPFMVDNMIPTGAQVTGGTLRAVGIASTRRSSLLPDVPTVVEQGYPDVVAASFYGLLAPSGTPMAIVEKLHRTVVAAVNESDVRERMLKMGFEVQLSTPKEFAEHMRREVDRWTPIVQAAGIKP